LLSERRVSVTMRESPLTKWQREVIEVILWRNASPFLYMFLDRRVSVTMRESPLAKWKREEIEVILRRNASPFSAHVFGSKSIRHDARVAIDKMKTRGIEVILIWGSVNSLPWENDQWLKRGYCVLDMTMLMVLNITTCCWNEEYPSWCESCHWHMTMRGNRSNIEKRGEYVPNLRTTPLFSILLLLEDIPKKLREMTNDWRCVRDINMHMALRIIKTCCRN
jgi:hypothetical protein